MKRMPYDIIQASNLVTLKKETEFMRKILYYIIVYKSLNDLPHPPTPSLSLSPPLPPRHPPPPSLPRPPSSLPPPKPCQVFVLVVIVHLRRLISGHAHRLARGLRGDNQLSHLYSSITFPFRIPEEHQIMIIGHSSPCIKLMYFSCRLGQCYFITWQILMLLYAKDIFLYLLPFQIKLLQPPYILV